MKRTWSFIGLFLGLVVLVALLGAACTGDTGTQGVQGVQGEQGPQGLQGDPGESVGASFAIKLDPDEPGCGGVCHEAESPFATEPGQYTLNYEANHAFAGHNFDVSENFTPLALNTCLACHAVGTGDREGMGNVASKALRDIVHPVHLTAEHFTVEVDEEERQGDCFTCHEVSGASTTGLY